MSSTAKTKAMVRVSLAGLIWISSLAIAAAQGSAQPDTAHQVDPKACAPSERQQQGATSPNAPATTGEDLSSKLARTDGIICPPNVDPNIKAPTPQTGRMPVIPPPGSPGGDQSVQPK